MKEEARKACHLWFEAYAGSESDLVADAAGLDLEHSALLVGTDEGYNRIRDLLAEDERISNRKQQRRYVPVTLTATTTVEPNRMVSTSTGILFQGVERRTVRRKLAEREATQAGSSGRGKASKLATQASLTPLGESAVEAAIDLGAQAKEMSIGRMYECVFACFLMEWRKRNW